MNETNEHNPDGLTPEQYGAPEWRLLRKGECIQAGDQYGPFSSKRDDWDTVSKHGGLVGKAVDPYCSIRRRVSPTLAEQSQRRAEGSIAAVADQSARIAELERELLIERGEVEAGDRVLKDQDEEITELKRRGEELTGEIEGTEPLAADPTKWGLRAMCRGFKEQADAFRAEVERLKDQAAYWKRERDVADTELRRVQSTAGNEVSLLRKALESCDAKRKETAKDFELAFRLVREENDDLRAQLAEREEDRALLDWLLDYITQNGAGGIADLEWTCTNPDGADVLTPDRMDIAFDRAAIRAARAQEDGK